MIIFLGIAIWLAIGAGSVVWGRNKLNRIAPGYFDPVLWATSAFGPLGWLIVWVALR